MRKTLIFLCISFIGLLLTATVSTADGREYSRQRDSGSRDLSVTKAEWSGDSQTLDLVAREGRGVATLTVLYNGSSYIMSYNNRRRRYELTLEPVCYSETLTVQSSTGASVDTVVLDRQGTGSTFSCNDGGGASGPEFGIISAVWTGDGQHLSVRAEEGNGTETLTVVYNGSSYDMVFNSSENQYELDLDSVCFVDVVTVQSTSGAVDGYQVADPTGMGSEWPCGGFGCPDNDGDGYMDAACGGDDCNDSDPNIYPGAEEICSDGIDQSCSGVPDDGCSTGGGGNGGGGPHDNLTYAQYPNNCIACHQDKGLEMLESTHYKWVGPAPDMVNPTQQQGKLTNAVNSYCVNILGDWAVCGSCHAGRGKRPDDPTAGLENVDCLVCHSPEYATQRTRLPDGSLGVPTPSDSMVQNVSKPDRSNCLTCHAKAGGGDAVKRGDLSLALAHNADPDFDVHMSTSGSNLACQSCHVFDNHKVIGKGSDLRPTDDLVRGARVNCTTCHTDKASSNGHSNENINRHTARVACQTCHIPTYAKQATEVHRDWLLHHDGSPADGASGPGHPWTEKAADLIPNYKFWNGKSNNALLGDDAALTYDAELGTYPTSRPIGGIDDQDSKIYPFKYKTANQPMTNVGNKLIALDTFEYLKRSGDVESAIQSGLENMGRSANEPYQWVTTDTYQLLNHGVNPSSAALSCNDCHGGSQVDLKADLGYTLKGPRNDVCTQCHGIKEAKPFLTIHDKHVKDKRYDCSNCHTFSRPERGLRM